MGEYIAEVDHAVAIQTTGDNRAVGQNPKLVLEAVAGKSCALHRRRAVGPCETIAPFEVDVVPQFYATGIGFPLLGDIFVQVLEGGFVFSVIAIPIPEPKNDNGSLFCRFFGKVGQLQKVSAVIHARSVLETVYGQVHLMYSCRQQGIPAFVEQGTVGGNDRPITPLPCHLYELGEQRMGERFAHQVVVDIFGLFG